jgi:hypothetical protein
MENLKDIVLAPDGDYDWETYGVESDQSEIIEDARGNKAASNVEGGKQDVSNPTA